MAPRPSLIALLAPCLLAFAATATGAPAAGPPASFGDIQVLMSDPTVRLLDARPRADYDKGHAPGSVWVDVKAAQAIAARPGGLTDLGAWEAWSAPLGIGPETKVLIFDGARQLDAARIWWLLSYLGVGRVGLIDGNFPLWEAEGGPVTADAPKVEARAFAVAFQPGRHANRDEVLAALKDGKTAIVDARSRGEYTGEQKSSKRGGHIPAACRLEWSELVDTAGRFLPKEALQAKVAALGLRPGEPVIAHCQGGGRASVDAFAFERIGHPTRNFYLGWSDWGNAADTPIVEGAEPGPRR